MSTTAKFLAGAAIFGLMPKVAEGAERISGGEKVIELEEKILSPAQKMKDVLPFEMPEITKFKTLSELQIATPRLRFVQNMEQRRFTSAIVIHHAGMTRNEDISLKSIHQMHLNNGWAGVGYHFVVHKNGVIEHARPIERVGAHAYKHNLYTVGICMTGNLDIGVPTLEQTLATEKLVAALCFQYDITPSSQTIFGHRDLCATDCPGYNFYPRMPELIQNVNATLSKIK